MGKSFEDDVPRLTQVRGKLVAVGFAPLFVTLKTGDKTLRLQCEPQLLRSRAAMLRELGVEVVRLKLEYGRKCC